MQRTIGSMGSEYTRLHLDPEAIPIVARLDWNPIARRVFIDQNVALHPLLAVSPVRMTYLKLDPRILL